MNYRNFYKTKQVTGQDILNLLPEGVDLKEFKKGIAKEKAYTKNDFAAAKLACENLRQDNQYYSKIHEELESDIEGDTDVVSDDDGGYPKGPNGELNIPHLGDPISLGKIITVGAEFGSTANGAVSGMTSVKSDGDKETITAGGKKVDNSVVSKSVGGEVVPGEGQKQGGLNSKGTIAGTKPLAEAKKIVGKVVKNVLKEIRFDAKSGKWLKIHESKKECKCGKSKGDCKCMEETVDMKMGPSYKTVQPRQYKVSDDDVARTNQYEPEITEMYDEEEECMMNERYVALATAQRNLSKTELTELKNLREKLENLSENNWIQKAVNPDHKGYCTPMSKSTCTPHRKALAKRFKKGIGENGEEQEAPSDREARHNYNQRINSTNKRDKNRYECPTCKTPNALSAYEKQQGYQCNSCANAEEGVYESTQMKNGPSYKVVAGRQARVQKDDHARTVQFQPDMTENEENQTQSQFDTIVNRMSPQDAEKMLNSVEKCLSAGKFTTPTSVKSANLVKSLILQKHPHLAHKPCGMHETEDKSVCPECNSNNVNSLPGEDNHVNGKGSHICDDCEHSWNDAEPEDPLANKSEEPVDEQEICPICHEAKCTCGDEMYEAGGGMVQHSSGRTVNDLPQNPKIRWGNEVD